MKLDSVAIQNFRGYSDVQELQIDDLTTIVGRNDVGKSTVLEALAIFFGDDSVKPDVRDLNLKADVPEFVITCTFSDPPDSLVLDAQAETTLASEFLLTEDGRLRVRKKWTCTGLKPKEDVYLVAHHPSKAGYSDLLQLTNSALKARVADLLDPEQSSTVNKGVNHLMRKALWEAGGDLLIEEQEIPVSKEDSKRIWERMATLMPLFALFQSDRASRDSDSEVQDPMKLAVTLALSDTNVMDSLELVVSAVRARATDLADRTHIALAELDPDLADGLVPTFRSDPKWATLFSIALEGADGVPLNKRGSGVRRLVLVSFFRAEAQRQVDQGTRRSVIYAVEEPETSQHPRNQKVLLDSFQKLAAAGASQVILTTHSPAIAGHLPVDSLRFVTKARDSAPVVVNATESTRQLIADELGVLPDDRVRVLICVEGPNDVKALSELSRALSKDDHSVIDLSTDGRIAFVPLGGGTLRQWVAENYLRGLGRPEFHLYDSDVEKYAEATAKVNARADGSIGRMTKRREMENYLHPQAIHHAMGVSLEFGPEDDVPLLISSLLREDPERVNLNARNVKAHLAEHAFPAMTKELIEATDPDGEVRSWLKDIDEMIVAG